MALGVTVVGVRASLGMTGSSDSVSGRVVAKRMIAAWVIVAVGRQIQTDDPGVLTAGMSPKVLATGKWSWW